MWLFNYWLFSIMQNSILIAQESYQSLGIKKKNPYVSRIDFFAFCVYKNVSQNMICFFVYGFKLQWLPSTKDNVNVFIFTKSKKIVKRFCIQKVRHFANSQTISVTFFLSGWKVWPIISNILQSGWSIRPIVRTTFSWNCFLRFFVTFNISQTCV